MVRLFAASILFAAGCMMSPASAQDDKVTTAPWSVEKANAWYAKQPWLVGANYAPQTAINQLEMWQADTFDPETIDKEMGWAQSLGFNSMRVFLHHMLWEQDKEGFLKRMEQFLEICDKHDIGVMFVLFDSVWDPFPKLGKQPEPKRNVHNSGWVQSPGAEVLKDPSKHDALKDYVVGVVSHFKNDNRVQVWDIWNEPDNPVPQYKDVELPNKKELMLPLMKKAFAWAREAKPTQPLTAGLWVGHFENPEKMKSWEKFQVEQSDVISFHNYQELDKIKTCVTNLQRYNRPIFCTEYMARPLGSTFDPVMGYFKEQKVAAYNWGFVSGKSQTIFPWDSWDKQYTDEPPLWFHDIFREDGTPYKQEEVDYIRSLTGAGDSATTGTNKKAPAKKGAKARDAKAKAGTGKKSAAAKPAGEKAAGKKKPTS